MVLIAAGGGGALLLVIMLLTVFCYCRRRKRFDTGSGRGLFDGVPSPGDTETTGSYGISMQSLGSDTTTDDFDNRGVGVVVNSMTPGPEEGLEFDDDVSTVGQFGIGTSPSFTRKPGRLSTPMYLSDSSVFQTPKSNKDQGDPDDTMEL
jgi:hypothetical protein